MESRNIRALVVYSKSAFFYDQAQPRGISYEAPRELETAVNNKFKTGNRPVQVTADSDRGTGTVVDRRVVAI